MKPKCLCDIIKVSIDEAVKQTLQTSESWKKQQEHVASLVAREACLITEVAKLLKQNKELLEMERENRAKVDALRKGIGQV